VPTGGSDATSMPVSVAIALRAYGRVGRSPVGSAPVRNGPVDPDQLETVCGSDPSFICREIFERTDSRGLAEGADIVFAKPLSIAIVLVVAWVVLRVLRRVIDKFVATIASQTGTVSIRAAARAETLGHVLRSITAFAVWTIAAITILGEVGINLGPLIAGAGIAGVALGFGAQSLVRDFLVGIAIVVEDQYGVGDTIDVGELSGRQVTGVVEAVSLRATRLRSNDGTVWHVPNGAILRVGNMSQQVTAIDPDRS
jgi:moderate conductance mechanosensitive channel